MRRSPSACCVDAYATLDVAGAPLDQAVVELDHVVPGELRPLVAPANLPVPPMIVPSIRFVCCALALEFSEYLIAVLIGPNTAAHETCFTVAERDDFWRGSPRQGAPHLTGSIVPLRLMIDALRLTPSESVRRVPAAFHEPVNSPHLPAAMFDFGGSAAGPQAHAISVEPTRTSRLPCRSRGLI